MESLKTNNKPGVSDSFKNEVYVTTNGEYEVLEKYVRFDRKALFRHNCKECNNTEFRVNPKHFMSGDKCPVCKEASEKNVSKAEIKAEEKTVLENFPVIETVEQIKIENLEQNSAKKKITSNYKINEAVQQMLVDFVKKNSFFPNGKFIKKNYKKCGLPSYDTIKKAFGNMPYDQIQKQVCKVVNEE